MFSKRCNSLPNVVDANVISAFLSRTTYESFFHKLGCVKPCTTHDLLVITMNHAFDEEAIRAVFSGDLDRGKAKREDQGEGPSTQKGKKNKKDRHRPTNPALVATAV